MIENEAALLNDAKKLDRDALLAIFDCYAPAIYRYALQLCYDPLESDNLVGEVFSKLLEQFALGKGPATSLQTHLYQTAYRCIVDRAPHNHNKRQISIETAVHPTARLSVMSSHAQKQTFMGVWVSALKNKLTDLQQHVIVLRLLEGFSAEETAVIINKKADHVRAIENRGITKLRRALQIHWKKNQSNL